MAVPVIAGPLLIVLQDVISLADFLEFLLGRLVARIAVRVIIHGQLAVCPLQLVGIGRSRHAEYFVKVPLRHLSTDIRPKLGCTGGRPRPEPGTSKPRKTAETPGLSGTAPLLIVDLLEIGVNDLVVSGSTARSAAAGGTRSGTTARLGALRCPVHGFAELHRDLGQGLGLL